MEVVVMVLFVPIGLIMQMDVPVLHWAFMPVPIMTTASPLVTIFVPAQMIALPLA